MPTQETIRRWLEQAIRLHQKNRTTEARVFYTKVLTFLPDDPDANHLIGLIEDKDGHRDLALERLTKARCLDPGNAELLSNLGNLYRSMGRIEDAVEAFQAGLAIKPNLPALHNNLGVAFQEAGRHDRAAASFRAALKLNPDYAEAHNNLGTSLVNLGRLDQAISSFIEAIGLMPNYDKARGNLEAVLRRLEKSASSGGDSSAAGLVANAYDRLGQIHLKRNAVEPALAAFDKALVRSPDDFDVAARRLDCLIRLKRPADMVAALEKLIVVAPQNARFHALLGQAYGQLGSTEPSIAALRRAVALDPDNAGAYQMLARALSLAENEDLLAGMIDAYDRAAPDSTERMRMAFALAKAKEDQSNYQQAFAYLLEANRIRRGRLGFDLEGARHRFERLREVFTPALMREAQTGGKNGKATIFIVGMPRSGTTLVESIIAAHRAVEPCGELDVMIEAAARIGLRDRRQPPLFERFGADAPFDRLARTYLDGVHRAVPAAATAERFTDKMPDNFWNIGLIRLAFPEATIVHCRRLPADTCLSLFKSDFANTGHRYANDLSELGAYYNLYRDTMRHWDEILPPGSIKTVDYESLVADPEAESRRLIEMCGLDWDDNCLSFYDTERDVHTASLYQVRRPIYASSVQLAELYGENLRPLLDVIEAPGNADSGRVTRSRPA